VDPKAFRSQGRNTPFAGFELPAPVVMTLVAGRTVYSHIPRHPPELTPQRRAR